MNNIDVIKCFYQDAIAYATQSIIWVRDLAIAILAYKQLLTFPITRRK